MSRKLLVLSILVIAGLLLAACGGTPAVEAPVEDAPVEEAPVEEAAPEEPAEPAAEEDTIDIGFISAFTGVFSSFGKMQKEGAELALDEYNYEVAGKKINVIYEDDQLDNEQAVTKAKKLVEQDDVDVLTGLVSGDEGLTVGDYMKDKGIPVVPMYSASEDMTMREFFPGVVSGNLDRRTGTRCLWLLPGQRIRL